MQTWAHSGSNRFGPASLIWESTPSLRQPDVDGHGPTSDVDQFNRFIATRTICGNQCSFSNAQNCRVPEPSCLEFLHQVHVLYYEAPAASPSSLRINFIHSERRYLISASTPRIKTRRASSRSRAMPPIIHSMISSCMDFIPLHKWRVI